METPRPFFEQGTPLPHAPRLLLLSRHFPPGQAAGARRWEKLAHFAAARGWGLDVFTLAPQDLGASDPARLEALPAGTRVYGIPERRHWLSRLVEGAWRMLRPRRASRGAHDGGAEGVRAPAAEATPDWVKKEAVTYGLGSLAGWVRNLEVVLEFANLGAWAGAAGRAAAAVHEPGRHRAVVSCGPPHMVHAAARRLSRRFGLPLVVDLRDPWSAAERVHASTASPLWYRLAEHFESLAFAQASLVVMNTPPALDVMRSRHPAEASKMICALNGFDLDALPAPAHAEAFVLAYTGSIYIDRNPRNLFRAVRRVADELRLAADDLQIELMGHLGQIEGQSIAEIARQEGVSELVTLHPPGTVRDVAALLARAAVLVNLPQDSHLAIPSKLYEYMVYPSWILALAERDSATGRILAGTAAAVVAPDDVDGIAAFVRRCYRAYRAGERPRPVAQDPTLGRAHQAKLLFDALERCVGAPADEAGGRR